MFENLNHTYYQSDKVKLYHGNTLGVLKTFPDEFVDCIITSPPYWALRDYQLESQIWDGDEKCEHQWNTVYKPPMGGKNHPDRPANVGSNKMLDKTDLRGIGIYSNFCSLCNAWRGSLGLEPNFELYIKHLCNIFDEVKRVLKKTGTCWVNLGDTYAGSGNGTNDYRTEASKSIQGIGKYANRDYQGMGSAKALHHELHRYETRGKTKEVPAKSLCLIPQRFAIEMTNSNWILREDLTKEEKEYVLTQLTKRGII